MPPRPDVSTERRAQIIQAAMACFSRKGYTNTTMDDIVAESGLSKGTLYWYFDSKDDLFSSATAAFLEDFGQAALAELEQVDAVAEKLRVGARSMVDLARRAEGLFGLFIEFWLQSEHREEGSRFWAEMLVEYETTIADIIEEGVRSGEFRPVDARALVWAIMAAYDGLAAYGMFLPDMNLEQISEVFIETLLKGLMADG
jgi:AcrR family transcriptional regulator